MKSWREIQRESITDLDQLAEFLDLTAKQQAHLAKRRPFGLLLPRRLASKMEKRTLEDPLLRQFVPLADEGKASPGFVADPVGDQEARTVTRLLKKYQGRALLVTTSACAMHCRYCFRQNFDYSAAETGYSEELAAITADESLREVILSGGDPLSLSDATLTRLINALDTIPHLRRLRFHTRFPVGIPERISAELLELLRATRLQVWFVVHVNHPKELDDDVLAALKRVQKLGIPVLNQAVLLHGVNDSVNVLTELSETLADHGVMPYYLHQLDRVQGAAHFEVDETEGLRLVEGVRQRLSGYAVPTYVREIAGEPSKSPLRVVGTS